MSARDTECAGVKNKRKGGTFARFHDVHDSMERIELVVSRDSGRHLIIVTRFDRLGIHCGIILRLLILLCLSSCYSQPLRRLAITGSTRRCRSSPSRPSLQPERRAPCRRLFGTRQSAYQTGIDRVHSPKPCSLLTPGKDQRRVRAGRPRLRPLTLVGRPVLLHPAMRGRPRRATISWMVLYVVCVESGLTCRWLPRRCPRSPAGRYRRRSPRTRSRVRPGSRGCRLRALVADN